MTRNKIRLIFWIVIALLLWTVIEARADSQYPSADQLYFPVSYAYQVQWGVVSESRAGVTEQYWNPSTPLGVSVRWDLVENIRGVYDWSSADETIGSLPPFLITVKTSPGWAIVKGEPACRLPEFEYWEDFARFIGEVASRYHPDYIGIWNEPDHAESAYPDLFGCVGDGVLYGKFVKYVRNHVDLGDTQYLIGNVSRIMGPFAYDTLRWSSGHMDAFGLHCYGYVIDGQYVSDCVEQYEFLDALIKNENSDAVIILTETAVLCQDECALETFQEAQLQHYEMLKSIDGVKLWYTVCCNGWPVEMPTDMYPNPVWYEYMGLSVE